MGLFVLLIKFSDKDFSDEKFKLFFKALSITILGSITGLLGSELFIRSLGVYLATYLAIGIIMLLALASLSITRASLVMVVFLVYKMLYVLALAFLFFPGRSL
jgi:hypothetical protein